MAFGLERLGGDLGGGGSYLDDFDPELARGTAPVTGFLEMISRPGWALRSAMVGDLEAAGKHVAQFAMDLPAGWIDKRLSISNMIFGDGDITDPHEKLEFSDVLEQWGMPAPLKGSWGRLGTDILGGLIDPLSLVGGPLAGLGRKALTGAGTKVGREIVEAALKGGRTGFAEVLGDPNAWKAMGATEKAKKIDKIVYDLLPDTAKIKLGAQGADDMDWLKLAGDELEEVVKGLRKNDWIDTPSIGSIGVPFRKSPGMQFGLAAGEWAFDNVPGLEGLMRAKDHTIGSLWDRTLKYANVLPPGFRTAVMGFLGDRTARESYIREDIFKAFSTDAGIANMRQPHYWDSLTKLGEEVAKDEDIFKRELNRFVPTGDEDSLNFRATLVNTLTERAKINRKSVPIMAEKIEGTIRNRLKTKFSGGEVVTRKGVKGVELDFEETLNDVLTQFGQDPAVGTPIIRDSAGNAGKAPIKIFAPLNDSLVADLSEKSVEDLDKLMNKWLNTSLKQVGAQIQARETALSLYKKGGLRTAGWGDEAAGELDIALKTGNYSPYADKLESFWQKAVDSPGLPDWYEGEKKSISALESIPGEAAMSVPDIAFHRLRTESNKLAKKVAEDLADSLVPSLGIDRDVFSWYIRDVFEEIKPNRGLIRTLLAGGELFDSKVPEELLKKGKILPGYRKKWGGLEKVYRTREGFLRKKFLWGGVNRIWKPLLTSAPVNLDYHFRNTIGSVFMLATDPNVGWTGVDVVMKMPGLVLGTRPKAMNAYLKALHVDPAKSAEGMEQLKTMSGEVGKTGLTHEEFIKAARTFLGGGRSNDSADLMRDLGDTMAELQHFSKELELPPPSKLGKAWNVFQKAGENMSNWVENQMRLHSFQKNIEAGLTIPEAAKRTQTTLVDYTVQSKGDRMIRDIFPFIRFRIGSLAWTKAVLTRPRNLSQIAQVKRSMEDPNYFPDPTRPHSSWDNLNLTLPGYLPFSGDDPAQADRLSVSLGAGAQNSIENLGILLGGVTLGNMGNFRHILTEAHPVFGLLFDATYGKDLYSGKPFASDVRASALQSLIPGLTETGKSRWGVERQEINGIVKALMENSPISRQLDTVNEVLETLEGERGLGDALMRRVGGIRTYKPDALNNFKNKLATIIEQRIGSGDIYEYLMPLSSRAPEDTPAEIRLLLEDLQKARGMIRDRGRKETQADTRLGLATGGRGF